MMQLFALFHLNLMYSAIETDQRPEVVRRCYHRLLDLAEEGLPLAIEATGLTLELAARIDPAWLERLRRLVTGGGVSFVGSGYSQVIAPLVPAAVNRRNLALGRDAYRAMLDLEPRIWMVNEMAYSGGLPPLYREVGAEAIVMEWNNARKANPEWDRRFGYHRQTAVGSDGCALPVIWIDTLDFQQLQRRTRNQITQEEFAAHWRRRRDACPGGGFAALYGSDAEVFDFRPGRFRDEGDPVRGEWDILGRAVAALAAEEGFALVDLPAVLDEPAGELCGRPLRLETPVQPVVVKKQEKYNLNRWAVTGRGDMEANTACHRIAAHLQAADCQDPDAWRRLCRLWSSDVRTHLTAGRWREFLAETAAERQPLTSLVEGSPLPLPDPLPDRPELTCGGSTAILDLRRGLAVRQVRFGPDEGPALGTLPHGYFDDIALGADFYTGHGVVQRPGTAKLTDLMPCSSSLEMLETPAGDLVVQARIVDGDLAVTKQIVLRRESPALELRGVLSLPRREPAEIHPVHLTVMPEFLAPDRLAFATRNGGQDLETFALPAQGVHHAEAYSTLVTAKGGLGATDGRVILGDDRRRIVVEHDPLICALIPTVRYLPTGDGRYFLRLRYSAQEIDETFVPHPDPWTVSWSVRVTVEDKGLQTTETA